MVQDENITWQLEDTGHLRMTFQGSIGIDNTTAILGQCRDVLEKTEVKKVSCDLAAVKYLDGAGAALLFTFEDICRERRIIFELTSLPPHVKGMLDLFDPQILHKTLIAKKSRENWLEQIGKVTLSILEDAKIAIEFVGSLAMSFCNLLRHPGKLRMRDTLLYMEYSGADAFPIVMLIHFLLGLIMAFQAAVQLRQFGGNIFVANLVGISMVRELGPLMTALIVAGRSGSSFAAEIGTMKVSEEIDALVTMGFEPIRFLVIPKILAVMIMMPCLTLMADMIGISGGAIIAVTSLDLTVFQYVNQTYKALQLGDVLSGLGKSVIFGFLIAVIGCYRGFQVKGGAQGVGQATTSAVVTSIFFIIFADAIYTMIGHFYPGN